MCQKTKDYVLLEFGSILGPTTTVRRLRCDKSEITWPPSIAPGDRIPHEGPTHLDLYPNGTARHVFRWVCSEFRLVRTHNATILWASHDHPPRPKRGKGEILHPQAGGKWEEPVAWVESLKPPSAGMIPPPAVGMVGAPG